MSDASSDHLTATGSRLHLGPRVPRREIASFPTRRATQIVLKSWVIVTAFALGTAADQLVPSIDAMVIEARREVRIALGLPKRWLSIPTSPQAAERETVPCPDLDSALVVVTGGQSNAANTNSRISAAAPDAPVHTFWQGECYRTEDPVLGATAQGGSLWPLFGEALAEETGRPVLFIHGAIGGTQVPDWLDERSGYLSALTGRIEDARAAGYEPDWILWHQGETDAAVQATMEPFRDELAQLAGSVLETAPEARLYLFQVSKCVGEPRADGVPHIREAQTEVAGADERILLGMNTDELDDDMRWDTCHFNSMGRDAVVSRVVADLVGAGTTSPEEGS